MAPRELLLRLAVAAVLGSLIGLDRQRLDKTAGLRTHMLVSVGSALVMIVSSYGFEEVLNPGRVVLDPSRVAAQVVSGIGFLGAGAILRKNQSVHGLTTAASVWVVAAIGLAAGGGLYVAASSATLIILVILAVIKPLEDRLLGGSHKLTLTIVAGKDLSMAEIESRVRSVGFTVLALRVRSRKRLADWQIEMTLGGPAESKQAALIDALNGVEGVHAVAYG
ncbi:MAG: MgtC/SapB family protein [Isosphaeraceae bacterium]